MKVVIPVDGSDTAEKAFDWYFDNFHKPDNEVVIIHISDQPRLPSISLTGTFPAEEISKLMIENNKKIAEVENKFTVRCGQRKAKNKILMVPGEGGGPGQQVVKIAKEQNADLIVMGSRGLGTFRRTVLGSVSDYVIHHTKVPVCICPKS